MYTINNLLYFAIIFYSLPCFYPLHAGQEEETAKTVLYTDPFISTRATGLGGALSTLADGIHAPFYNPAGIGGIHWEENKPPAIRQLNLPYIGADMNTNATKLNNELSQKSAKTSSAATETILKANEGKRQFARTSALLSFGYNRLIILQALDYQIAAFRKKDNLVEDEKNLQAAYRNQSSTGIGFSAVNPKETFYLGIYTAYQHRTEFEGALSYATLTTPSTRSQVLSDSTSSTSGYATHAGMLWVLGQKNRPAIAVVVNNLGGTRYTGGGSSSSTTERKDPETLTIGASISPRVGKGAFNWIIEGQDLMNPTLSVAKKWRTGIELTLGGFGSEGWLGFRVGYNPTGVSGGINLNLGLLQFEFASTVQDIGIGNHIVSERRNVAVISVNARDE